MYDLMATVVHILDSRAGGSLVAHIKVGETYHQRKEVSGEPRAGVFLVVATVESQFRPYLESEQECSSHHLGILCISTGSYPPAVVSLQRLSH